MNKLKRTTLLLAVSLTALLAGCTDAQQANLGSFGDKHKITCFSGGVEVASGESTGKPQVSNSGVITWTDGEYKYGAKAHCIYTTKL